MSNVKSPAQGELFESECKGQKRIKSLIDILVMLLSMTHSRMAS